MPPVHPRVPRRGIERHTAVNLRRKFALVSARNKRATSRKACSSALRRGNFNRRPAHGEGHVNEFSDRGSTPLGSTKITKKAYASAPFVILRDLIKGVERSEQNNPVSCFVNGDRRILRDVTKNKIQSIEQNSRTTPLGSTKIKKRLWATYHKAGRIAQERPF